MNKFFYCLLVWLSLLLSGCGGGGGDPGATSSSGATATSGLAVAIELVDVTGNSVTSRSIVPGVSYYAKVKITQGRSQPVGNAFVEIAATTGAELVAFPSGTTRITDASGTALFEIKMSAAGLNGGVILSVTSSLGTASGSNTLNMQTTGGTGVADADAPLAISLSILDTNGQVVGDRSIIPNVSRTIRAVVTNSKGSLIQNALVKVTASDGSELINFSSITSGLTDASGVITFPVEMSRLQKNGAVVINATASIDSRSASATLNAQAKGGAGSDADSVLTVSMQMLDTSGAVVPDRSIQPNQRRVIRVTVANDKGIPQQNAFVGLNASIGSDLISITGQDTGLTNASGYIDFAVEMSRAQKNGAAILNASATLGAKQSSATLNIQTTGGSGGDVVELLTLQLSLVDANGNTLTDRSVSQTRSQSLKVVVRNSTNAPQPFAFVSVTFTQGSSLIKVVGSANKLTGSDGVVLFDLAPNSVSSTGAAVVSVTGTVGAVSGTATLTLQTTSGTVSLGSLQINPVRVQKGQAVNVEVPVSVNGQPAGSNSVSVDFSSSCGTVSPSPAIVSGNGRASVVIQTTSSGSCTVTASAPGATSVTGSYQVDDAPINSLRFISATPEIIYQKNSPGVSTSLVRFRLLNSIGVAVQGQVISASLSNADGGIDFCGSPSEGPTDANGEVVFSVCAGTLPTTLMVKAEVKANTTINTNSNRLTIQTGLPTQRFFDISATALNFYVGAGRYTDGGTIRGTSYFSGKTTSINVYLADRQGNPVPDGTPVVFVAEGGQINSSGASSCILRNGGCTVQLIGQEYRPWGTASGDPRPGRVTILAYADGEETFIDLNKNNRYDAGEPYEELGVPYLDATEDGNYNQQFANLGANTNDGENKYPLPVINGVAVEGTSSCSSSSSSLSQAAIDQGISVANTCNGKWDGFTKVRRKIVIVFSGGEIGVPSGPCTEGTADGGFSRHIPCRNRTQVITNSGGLISALISDYNGNPLPADATMSYEDVSKVDGCELTPLVTGSYGSTTEPRTMSVAYNGVCAAARANIALKVSVDGKTSSFVVQAQ